MKTDRMAENYNLCFCTGVPHCSQFHINPEMLKLNTIKYVNIYTYFGK